MAALAYLQLDSNYDPVFANNTSLVNAAAVAQAVLTRLNLFFGEWWENLTLGLPVFQSMLGQLGSPQALAAMRLVISQNIAGTPYVTAVQNVQLKFTGGMLSISASFQTAFGPATISTTVGG